MATVCGVIEHMVDQGISPAPDAETKALPPWMESMRKCLSDDSQPRNVKLFLLKIILNVESKFHQYAQYWIDSLLKVRRTETIILRNTTPVCTYFKSVY
jgi:hypothetical protein